MTGSLGTSWEAGGRQYVGVSTGVGGVGGLANDRDGIGGLRRDNPAAPLPPSRGELMVFALPKP